jgi:hypothetical protein
LVRTKKDAIRMRTHGASIRDVERDLGIPRSTLSGWFKKIRLTKRAQHALTVRKNKSLIKARIKAVLWHNQKKAERLVEAQAAAAKTLGRISTRDMATMELALAMLYLGEGTKAKVETSLGSSDHEILRFFVACLQNIYHVPTEKIRCELHLRADQNSRKLTQYWSEKLELPESNFGKPSFDRRTKGSPTFSHYKGVCLVRCGQVAIQRKLLYIAKMFCMEYAKQARG